MSKETIHTILKYLLLFALVIAFAMFGIPLVFKALGKGLKGIFDDPEKEKQDEIFLDWVKQTTGNAIPIGFNPLPIADNLQSAMEGLGTNEEAVISALTPLTADQLKLVITAFGKREKGWWPLNKELTLIGWIKDEFSGQELTRVLNFFTQAGIPTTD